MNIVDLENWILTLILLVWENSGLSMKCCDSLKLLVNVKICVFENSFDSVKSNVSICLSELEINWIRKHKCWNLEIIIFEIFVQNLWIEKCIRISLGIWIFGWNIDADVRASNELIIKSCSRVSCSAIYDICESIIVCKCIVLNLCDSCWDCECLNVTVTEWITRNCF